MRTQQVPPSVTTITGFTGAMLIGGMIALTGCTKEALEPVNTVEWYKAHEAERETMLKKCLNNPGQLAETPNCVNAKEAASRLFLGS